MAQSNALVNSELGLNGAGPAGAFEALSGGVFSGVGLQRGIAEWDTSTAQLRQLGAFAQIALKKSFFQLL